MSKAHRAVKFKIVKAHRQAQYEKALDLLIQGKDNPEYVNERYEKLKEIK
jgi:hypothetical protein